MRSLFLKTTLAFAVAVSWSGVPAAERAATDLGTGPQFKAMGPLTFGPDGVLFAADTNAAAIFAIELGQASATKAPGAKSIAGIDQKIAALLGTDVREIAVTDLAVHPSTRNAYHLGDARTGQRGHAGPAARGRRRHDRGRVDERSSLQPRRAAERPDREPG